MTTAARSLTLLLLGISGKFGAALEQLEPGFRGGEDSSVLVQTKLGIVQRDAVGSQQDEGRFTQHELSAATGPVPTDPIIPRDEAMNFHVYAKMESSEMPCAKCMETGFELMCRGKSMKFTFVPGFSGARVWGRFPRQNIGWNPKPGVWHNLTVVVRRSGIHTFIVTDGKDARHTWRKDFKRLNFFPRNPAQLDRCRLRTARETKRLWGFGTQCYGSPQYEQEHCLKLVNDPKPYQVLAPFQPHLNRQQPPVAARCNAKGDPHYITYEGARYNFQGIGTYTLSGASQGNWPHMSQVYNCPVKGAKHNISQQIGIAIELKGHVLTFFNMTARIDGAPITDYAVKHLDGVKVDIGDGVIVTEGPGKDYVEFRMALRFLKRAMLGYVIDIVVQVPPYAVPNTNGLCKERGTEPDHFVPANDPSNLFTMEDLRAMEQACCPNGVCTKPEGRPEEPTAEEVCAACSPPVEYMRAVENCSDAPSPTDCELDFCAACADEEEVLAAGQGEEEDPPEPIAQDDPKAQADPHCRNTRGEHFDILKQGPMEMIRVPDSGPLSGQDLLVVADIQPVTSDRCGQTVIKKVTMTGNWLALADPLVIAPGPDGVPTVPEVWEDYARDNENVAYEDQGKFFLQRSDAGPSSHAVRLHVHGVLIHTYQRLGAMTHVKYLDLGVQGLESLNDAGGLLGTDDHKVAAAPPDGCDPHGPQNVRLQQTGAELQEGLPAEEGASKFLSRAMVM